MSVVQRRGDPPPRPAPPPGPQGAPPSGPPGAPPPDAARLRRRKRIVIVAALVAFVLFAVVSPAALFAAGDWFGGIFTLIAGLFATVVVTVIAAAVTLGRRATGTGEDGVWHSDATTASAWGLVAASDSRPDSAPSSGYDSAADAGSSGSSDTGSSGGGDSGGSSSSD